MLHITQAQLDIFNEPLQRQMEANVIAFVMSRPELAEAGDAEFLQAACLQLIPRGRSNGLKTPNEIVRYVYLSLCLDYRASGQDVCQRLQIPYTGEALRRAEQHIIDVSKKGGTA